MTPQTTAEAHQHFSVGCFNKTWNLLDLESRTDEQVREMLALTHASLFHWMHREDCKAENLSIGLWQLSRVYSVIQSPQEAMRSAQDCLRESADLDPFYQGYAHEAICRAAILAEDFPQARHHLDLAQKRAIEVSEKENQDLLQADLKKLQEQFTS